MTRDFTGYNAATICRSALTAAELAAVCADVAQRVPGARLVANPIGNLAIFDADGDQVGWIDLAVDIYDQGGQIHLDDDD